MNKIVALLTEWRLITAESVCTLCIRLKNIFLVVCFDYLGPQILLNIKPFLRLSVSLLNYDSKTHNNCNHEGIHLIYYFFQDVVGWYKLRVIQTRSWHLEETASQKLTAASFKPDLFSVINTKYNNKLLFSSDWSALYKPQKG